MSEYITIAGDTFDIISRKVYGTESSAYLLIGANPGLFEPFSVGLSVIAPIDPNTPTNSLQRTFADGENEVSIFIRGKRFRHYPTVKIEMAMDSFSTFQLDAPFEPSDAAFRESFIPFSFETVEINVGGDPLFTGAMVDIEPKVTNAARTVVAKGYSRPGVLNDCTPPDSITPLEFNEQGLREIADTIATPFWLNVEFDGDQGDVFERVASDPGKKALTFLAELARQRGLVISDTPLGALLFQKSIDVEKAVPVAILREGESPVFSVVPDFDPQSYYSHITGIEPAFLGSAGERYTVKNKFVKGILRTLTYKVADVQSGSLKQAVEAKMGRMFGNMVSYTVTVPTWRDPKGNLWKPNTVITLNAPGAMVYDDYKFIVRRVSLSKDSKAETATLNLVLPGSFSGEFAGGLPWDEKTETTTRFKLPWE